MREADPVPQHLVEATSGLTAGIATTLFVHPLDLIKTRQQVDHARHTRKFNSVLLVQNILRTEGGPKALYRGISPNIIGNAVSWASYFLWYDVCKQALRRANGGENATLSSYQFFLASGSAGALTAVCTNPIWVLKTRMLSTSSGQLGAYKSSVEGIRSIYKIEGIRGFYRGLVPSLFGVVHGAIQFMVYERLKQNKLDSDSSRGAPLSNKDYLLFSATSKAIAGVVTYPYQVVRARLQAHNADVYYSNVREAISRTWRVEGPRGFYKGLGPNLLRIVPSSCITFLVYENTKAGLNDIFAKEKRAMES